MNWNLFSLVLTSATGWGVLAFGYLPVSVLRLHSRQPLVFVGAWAVVAATAPSAIFHWYLIFALIGLIAWTKLDRPAGKVCLTIAGSLGLSLGIVFPLEVSHALMLRESPFVLALLYLGGAVTGLAYVAFVLADRATETERWLPAFAKGLLILTLAWTVLLGAGLLRGSCPHPLDLFADPFTHALRVNYWTPLVPAIGLVVLTFFIYTASRRSAFRKTRWLAGIATLLSVAMNFLAQFVLR